VKSFVSKPSLKTYEPPPTYAIVDEPLVLVVVNGARVDVPLLLVVVNGASVVVPLVVEEEEEVEVVAVNVAVVGVYW
jgi:hypothetical protein